MSTPVSSTQCLMCSSAFLCCSSIFLRMSSDNAWKYFLLYEIHFHWPICWFYMHTNERQNKETNDNFHFRGFWWVLNEADRTTDWYFASEWTLYIPQNVCSSGVVVMMRGSTSKINRHSYVNIFFLEWLLRKQEPNDWRVIWLLSILGASVDNSTKLTNRRFIIKLAHRSLLKVIRMALFFFIISRVPHLKPVFLWKGNSNINNVSRVPSTMNFESESLEVVHYWWSTKLRFEDSIILYFQSHNLLYSNKSWMSKFHLKLFSKQRAALLYICICIVSLKYLKFINKNFQAPNSTKLKIRCWLQQL